MISKDDRFKDEQAFEVGLPELFGDKDTLVTYCWMYGPPRERPCPMCTSWLGSVNGNAADIKQRVALMILGRSTLERQYAFAQERGWRDLNFVQTIGDDYANDLGILMPDGRGADCRSRASEVEGQVTEVLPPDIDRKFNGASGSIAVCSGSCLESHVDQSRFRNPLTGPVEVKVLQTSQLTPRRVPLSGQARSLPQMSWVRDCQDSTSSLPIT